MAESVQFGPSLAIGGTPPVSSGGRVITEPSVARVSAQPRPLPAGRVSGDGSLRFPRLGGFGFYQPPLVQIELFPGSFIDQAESEVPAVIALRGANVNVTV